MCPKKACQFSKKYGDLTVKEISNSAAYFLF